MMELDAVTVWSLLQRLLGMIPEPPAQGGRTTPGSELFASLARQLAGRYRARRADSVPGKLITDKSESSRRSSYGRSVA